MKLKNIFENRAALSIGCVIDIHPDQAVRVLQFFPALGHINAGLQVSAGIPTHCSDHQRPPEKKNRGFSFWF